MRYTVEEPTDVTYSLENAKFAENREIIILNSITTDLFIEFPFFKIC